MTFAMFFIGGGDGSLGARSLNADDLAAIMDTDVYDPNDAMWTSSTVSKSDSGCYMVPQRAKYEEGHYSSSGWGELGRSEPWGYENAGDADGWVSRNISKSIDLLWGPTFTEEYFIDPTYFEMLCEGGVETWIATTFTYVYPLYTLFGLYHIKNANLITNVWDLCHGDGTWNTEQSDATTYASDKHSRAVFCIVTLSADCDWQVEWTGGLNVAWRNKLNVWNLII